jgi:transposase InsO family protein
LRIFCQFGFPYSIKSDNGREFVNATLERICELAKIEHHKIIAHDHHANGYVERNNCTVHETLKKMVLVCKDKSLKDWNLLVPAVAFALNSRMHSTFNATPFALMFGRGPFSLPFKNDIDQCTVQKLQ